MPSAFLRKVSNQMLLVLSDKVTTLLLNLLVAVAVARTMGPAEWGILSYGLALLMIIAPLMALGLNAVVTKELVQQQAKQQPLMTTVFVLRLIMSVLVLCATAGTLALNNLWFERQYQVLMILLGSGLTHAFAVFEFWFQAHMRLPIVVRQRLLLIAIMAVVKLWVLWFNADLFWLAAVYALELILVSLSCFYCYLRAGNVVKLKDFDYGLAKMMLKQSVWLTFAGVAAVLYLKIDQVMLLHLSGSHENGLYAVAARLSEVWYLLPEVALMVLFPALLQSQQNPERYQQHLQRLCDLLLIAAFIVAIVVFYSASNLVMVLFGEQYLGSVSMLQVHIWAGVFVFMRALASKYLLVAELHSFSLWSQGAGAMVNILLNFYFIPLWGGVGAAVATLLSYAVAGYLVFWCHRSTRPIAVIMTRSLLLPVTLGYRYWPAMFVQVRKFYLK